uniref:Putative carboxylesterase 7 isoform X1 n=1 Tax=Davidia involucrata TaxID=16924 RepID=A0A5B6ZIX3_DAVIN
MSKHPILRSTTSPLLCKTMYLSKQLLPRTISKFPSFPILNLASNVRYCSSTVQDRKIVLAVGSTNPEIAHEFRFFRVYKDGRIEKFRWPPQKIPPSDDPITGVKSRDVVISAEPQIAARIFLPPTPYPTRKLPVLLYVHGGGFSFESAFSTQIDRYVRKLVAEANVVAVSVEYRLAPEHPIPACYDDSWAALQWVASHAKGNGPDPWLNNYADFRRLFLAGDSAGGNICHTLAYRVGSIGLPWVRVVGAVLGHPYFGGTDDDKMWLYMCPTNGGLDDPRLKPDAGDLARLGCERVLVFVAEKDHLSGVGRAYYEELKKSGWGGTVEIVENEGEDHCFHLDDPTCQNAVALIGKIVSFINQD